MGRLYLELLTKSLLGELYWENEVRLRYLRDCIEGQDVYAFEALLRIGVARSRLCEEHRELNRTGRFADDREENAGFQHTMIGRLRLENVWKCLERIREDRIPGDLIECGVWRGGTTVFMRGFLKANGITDRLVWVADSFCGPPPPVLPQDEGLDLSAAKYPMLAIPLEEVRDLFERYGLLDDQVRFLKGWFKDTLPAAPIHSLALLRIDGDLYESTWDALSALYPSLSTGGFVIVDDYNCIPACRQAVDDYRRSEEITTPLEEIDWTGIFWQKACTNARSFATAPRNSE